VPPERSTSKYTFATHRVPWPRHNLRFSKSTVFKIMPVRRDFFSWVVSCVPMTSDDEKCPRPCIILRYFLDKKWGWIFHGSSIMIAFARPAKCHKISRWSESATPAVGSCIAQIFISRKTEVVGTIFGYSGVGNNTHDTALFMLLNDGSNMNIKWLSVWLQSPYRLRCRRETSTQFQPTLRGRIKTCIQHD